MEMAKTANRYSAEVRSHRAQHARTSCWLRSSGRCAPVAQCGRAAWCTAATATAACHTSRSATPNACPKLASAICRQHRQRYDNARVETINSLFKAEIIH